MEDGGEQVADGIKSFAFPGLAWLFSFVLGVAAFSLEGNSRVLGAFLLGALSPLLFVSAARAWFGVARKYPGGDPRGHISLFGFALVGSAPLAFGPLVLAAFLIYPAAVQQLVGAYWVAERLSADLGTEVEEVDSYVYALNHGDSGCGRDWFQFQMEAAAAERLLERADFQPGGISSESYYAAGSPADYPLLWYPFLTGEQIEPFHRRGGVDRAWLDHKQGVVYLDLDWCYP